MENMQVKIKLWSKLIQSAKLEDVMEDIQMNLHLRLDDKHNRNIFKLLLYLSHTADKYRNKENYESTGKKIAELTKILCSLLIKDVAYICCDLEARDLYIPQNATIDVLIKISSLRTV